MAPGTAFFQYYKIDAVTGGLDSIPNASLPLIHVAAVHSSPADTGQSALTDSIRAVQMTVTGMYDDPTKGPIYRSVTTMTKLLNAGLLYASECGQPPIAVNAPTATAYIDTSGSYADSVTLTWSASPDQNGGEKNVEFYMIYRQLVGGGRLGQPDRNGTGRHANVRVQRPGRHVAERPVSVQRARTKLHAVEFHRRDQ